MTTIEAPTGQRSRVPDQERVGWALALGGGGSVGLAYISGVLSGLADAGLDANSAGLVVGTSAGAVGAAAIRQGTRPADLMAMADAEPDPAAAASGRAPRHFERAWTGGLDLCNRMVGSSAVVARSMLKLPLPMPPAHLDAFFPGGLFRPRGTGMHRRFGDAWPADPVWLVAVDLKTRRRVALGRRPEDRAHPLHRAVMASCAVPGLYEPVRLGDRRYVDGGVNSTTSIDMALRNGSSHVLAVVPMGYHRTGRPSTAQRVMRGPAVRGVRRELLRAGERARDVLVVQPHLEDLELLGTNFLRATDNGRVAERARSRTHDLVARPEVAEFLAALTASTPARPRNPGPRVRPLVERR
jgi:NTE family protein